MCEFPLSLRLNTSFKVFLALAIGFFLWTSPVHSQEPGTLRGRVENGTPGAPVPAEMEVFLHTVEGNQASDVRQTQTSPSGEFQFEGLLLEQTLSYILSTEYQGVTYTLQLSSIPQDGSAFLKIYETTTDSQTIRLRSNNLLVGGEKPQSGRLDFLELAIIENVGDRTFISRPPGEGPMNLLRFSLPLGSQGLRVSTQLPGADTAQVDLGFAVLGPVPPGLHTIGFTYYLPYSQENLQFTRSFPFGAEFFRILFPTNLGNIQTSALQEQKPATIDNVTYRVLEGEGFKPGHSLNIELLDLPQPSLWERTLDSQRLRSLGTVGVPLLLGLALTGILAFAFTKRRTRGIHTSAREGHTAEAAETRQSLVEAIAQLDLRFREGDLDEERYGLQRAELKARLLRLAENQEASEK